MLKKLWIAALIGLASSSMAFAKLLPPYTKGDPYLGAGIGIQNNHGYNGLYGNIFGGMNISFCDTFYLAGEIFADSGSIPLSQKRFNRTTYGFGASIIPGFMMYQNTLAYARVGVATFRYNKTNSYSSGGQLGLGLQTTIAENWDIRGEYVYTGMGIIKDFGTSRFNFFNLGLLYKFK